jgi:hypothetical protein
MVAILLQVALEAEGKRFLRASRNGIAGQTLRVLRLVSLVLQFRSVRSI